MGYIDEQIQKMTAESDERISNNSKDSIKVDNNPINLESQEQNYNK